MTVIFLLLVLLLPTQLGFHFWPEWSYLYGIRVDYLSPTLYLIDFFVLAFIFSVFWRKRKLNLKAPLFLLLAYLAANALFVSQNQGAALYKFFRIFELVLLGFAVYNFPLSTLTYSRAKITFAFSIISTFTLGVLQMYRGGSLGGLSYWLGERSFSVSSAGISTATLWGQEFLRPYATFSHPNSLSGFVLVTLCLLYPWQTIISKFAFVLGILIVLLSFSQAAWVALVLLFIYTIIAWRFKEYMKIYKLAVLGAIILITALQLILKLKIVEEVDVRLVLGRSAGEMILANPLFGVGLNNFIGNLPDYSPNLHIWWLQPVHNIYLLVFSEIGAFGLLLVLWLVACFTVTRKKLPFALLLILFTGSLDHYWLTLQQNLLLATIVISLSLRKELKLL